MNCLRDEYIQMLIDGELSHEERQQAERHLEDCEKCGRRLAAQRELVLSYKSAIGSLPGEPGEIPDFVRAENKKVLSRKILYMIIYPVAAASMLLMFLFFPFNRNNEDGPEIFGMGSVSGEFDANLPMSDQDIEISFYNEEGKKLPSY